MRRWPRRFSDRINRIYRIEKEIDRWMVKIDLW